jgi:hypothetical protein
MQTDSNPTGKEYSQEEAIRILAECAEAREFIDIMEAIAIACLQKPMVFVSSRLH